MFMYVIERTIQVSNNFHTGGGLCIVAESPEAALVLANSTGGVEITSDDIEHSISYELLDSHDPKVYVFPVAGCC